MDRQKIVKLVVKGVLGLGVSAMIGTTIKAEGRVQDALDSYFKAKAN